MPPICPPGTDGPVKQSILNFVRNVTDQSSKDYVAPEDRIVTIDNDGTLWLEQPAYTQVIFMLSRYKQLAEIHPEWKKQPLYKLIASNQFQALTKKDFEQLFALTNSGMSVENYDLIVKKWLATAINPRFKHHYTELVYQPMLEIISYLQQNNFKVYIVSGGGQDFMRAFSQDTYHIQPENVIGTASKTHYTDINNHPNLTKMPAILFVCNKEGNPKLLIYS